MNTSCHSTIAARIETAAAAIILFLTTLTSCGRSSSPEPLDQWNDGTSTLHTADPVIAEGGSSSTTKNTKISDSPEKPSHNPAPKQASSFIRTASPVMK